MKEYPNQFYGRKYDVWGSILFALPIVVGLLLCGEVMKDSDTRDRRDLGIVLLVIGMVVAPIPLVFTYRLYALQWPILKIYREGLEIRIIGTTLPETPAWDVIGITQFSTMLILIWQFITLQMFRTRTVRLRWENITEMLVGKDFFSIAGRADKPVLVSYKKYSFGIPTDAVNEAVQFFLWNADSRETLPSWHDEEADKKRAEEEERRNLRIER